MKQPRLESGTEVPLSLDKVVVQTLTGAGLVLLSPLLQTRLRKWRQQIESTKNGEEPRPDLPLAP
jgi:hypothetical protein